MDGHDNIQLIDPNLARVNVTYGGQNGELIDPVAFDASEADVRAWVTEALRTGGIPGIPASPNADITGYVVERFAPTEARAWAAIFCRPKAEFGAAR